jgi:type I restriction enzyme, R subunit
MQTPSFKEDHISQIPAIQLLVNLGYKYLSPAEALELRRNNSTNVILESVLYEQLRKINRIYFKGEDYPFSNQNITNAVNTIKNIPYDGLVSTNEQVYDLLTLGKSFEENIQSSTKSFTLNYIDWDNIENNVFHVSEEFEVLASDGKRHRRPDIILFVNGVPLVVIECKRPDHKDPVHEAISQQIRNQTDEEIPKLFVYSQLLLAISKNENKYATTKTTESYWSFWKENINENQLSKIVNKELDTETKNRLFSNRYKYVRSYFDNMEKPGRQITEQDKLFYCLCRKERLLELIRKYIVFDAKVKKIARYQQYFAVKKAISRVKGFEKEGNRKGGVIWHTQGSGKSLTMVMIAIGLALEESIENPRIIVVSDRIHLDKQIAGTFKKCGMEPTRARTGKHLFGLLEGNKKNIITTVIDKFDTALKRRSIKIDFPNIFVLVDESHRSQYGRTHALMRKVLPKASYIGFTGTPLLKKDKNTANKFGGFIDKYTIDQAVKDKAVVPLLYDGRYVAQDVQKKQIDNWFGIVSEPLTEYQLIDLKKKYSKSDKVNATNQRLNMIAYDISKHFEDNFKDGISKG